MSLSKKQLLKSINALDHLEKELDKCMEHIFDENDGYYEVLSEIPGVVIDSKNKTFTIGGKMYCLQLVEQFTEKAM